ncbi:formimidoylglutamase [Parapedobacter tibetensis]|uniref:formimidoylglutamase n=1 Tax=Parapedobacter tibetensis TaxID=2972951 RepID=UPI00214D9E33|nr:formimidoylglutamase [Parapedobacter tibetensis]
METRGDHLIDSRCYRPSSMQQWQGRVDSTGEAQLRWHQHMKVLDLLQPANEVSPHAIVLLGFECDEGVKRNKGRPGAAKGPDAIRKALCNLPVFYPALPIYDAGNILCPDHDLEAAQCNLALAITQILQLSAFPILLGGGHEITYGHYYGIRNFLKKGAALPIGTVNFDAHFDNREPMESGANSGTGFWQIAQDCRENNEPFHCLTLGIQKTSNTPLLFETAHQTNTHYALAHHFHTDHKHILQQLTTAFPEEVNQLYITIDMDVFAAAYAPGVSAPAYNGILPDVIFFDCLDKLFDSGKVISLDIAELNPGYDIDMRTAKLAASIIFHVVERLATQNYKASNL